MSPSKKRERETELLPWLASCSTERAIHSRPFSEYLLLLDVRDSPKRVPQLIVNTSRRRSRHVLQYLTSGQLLHIDPPNFVLFSLSLSLSLLLSTIAWSLSDLNSKTLDPQTNKCRIFSSSTFISALCTNVLLPFKILRFRLWSQSHHDSGSSSARLVSLICIFLARSVQCLASHCVRMRCQLFFDTQTRVIETCQVVIFDLGVLLSTPFSVLCRWWELQHF
jgi:hypothetical protein